MNATRWLIAAGLLAVLSAFLAWQAVRQSEVERCREDGGVWDGANSRCLPQPSGPILQRDLYRS